MGSTLADSDAVTVPDPLATYRTDLDRDGYAIVRDAFDADTAAALHADVERLERELGIGPGTNGFEGRSTHRVYNLLAHGELYRQIPVHPVVLPLMHHLLGDGPLVSSLSSITIGPGEVAQPIHADDQVLPMPKPHRAIWMPWRAPTNPPGRQIAQIAWSTPSSATLA